MGRGGVVPADPRSTWSVWYVPGLIFIGWVIDLHIQRAFGNRSHYMTLADGSSVPGQIARTLGWLDVILKVVPFALYALWFTALWAPHSPRWWLALAISLLMALAECVLRGWAVIWGDLPTLMAKGTGLGTAVFTLLPLIGILSGIVARCSVWLTQR
jgi:hypothetical protein